MRADTARAASDLPIHLGHDLLSTPRHLSQDGHVLPGPGLLQPFEERRIAGRPLIVPASTHEAGGVNSASGAYSSMKASRSPRFQVSNQRRVTLRPSSDTPKSP